MKLRSLLLLGVLPTALYATPAIVPAKRFAQPAVEGEMVSALISNGDNDIISYAPPLDTPENIDAFFEALQRLYGVKRIYWRAAQIEQLVTHSHLRQEYFTASFLIEYLRQKYSDPKTSPTHTGPASAKARGMEIFGWAALFDFGGHEVIDSGKGNGPSFIESFLRLRNPQWIPRDRYGLRRMSGPLCFSYPEARKALVDHYLQLALQGGYHGIYFHAYTEQFGVRNENEFGFSEAIAEEYRQRHGVDPRRQPYESSKLAAVRGHFLTQFLRELKSAFRPHGIKVSLGLDPKRPHRPAPWLSSHQRDFSPAGNIEVDWRRYIDDGLVDELVSYANGPNLALAEELLAYSDGKGVEVGILHSATYPPEAAHFPASGVNRIISGQYRDLEYGAFEEKPVELLKEGDWLDKVSVLHQLTYDDTRWNLEAVLEAADDPHPWVRRRALEALLVRKSKDETVLAVIRKRLSDPVNAVRSFAVSAGFELGDAAMMPLLLDSIADCFEPTVTFAAGSGLANLEDSSVLLTALQHSDPLLRYLGLQAYGRGRHRITVPPQYHQLAKDSDPRVRWAVAANALRYRSPEMDATLLTLLDDSHPTVRSAAAVTLSTMYQSTSRWLGPQAWSVFGALSERFLRYGEKYKGDDREWGWRPLGEALERLGPRGEEVLRRALAQPADPTLADHAWNVLYVKASPSTFLIISDEEVEASLQEHPKIRKEPHSAPPPVKEPEWINWFDQRFDWREPQFAKDGSLGDPRDASARWQGLEGRVREGQAWIDTREKMPGTVVGARHDEPLRAGKVEIGVDLTPEAFGEGFSLLFTPSGQYSSTLQLYLDAQGALHAMKEDGKRQPLGVHAKAGEKLALRIMADLDHLHYRVAVGEQISPELPLKAGQNYNALVFLPARDVLVRLDRVEIRIPNPAVSNSSQP